MDGALRLLDVPPDDVQNWYTATPDSGHIVRTGRQAPDGAQAEPDYAEGVPE